MRAGLMSLTYVVGVAALMTNLVTVAHGETAFVPPQSYSAERYEEGWNKNPFTIKTAPVAVAKASFAENLAIGSYYGSSEDPTIVVVNTKTGERTRLKTGVESKGMVLKSASLGSSRRESTAVVTSGGETATLHYDDTYVRQLAAAGDRQQPGNGAGALPNGPGTPGAAANPAAGRMLSPTVGGGTAPPGNPALASRVATAQSQSSARGPAMGGGVVHPGAAPTLPPSAASRVLRTAPTRRVLTAPQPIR